MKFSMIVALVSFVAGCVDPRIAQLIDQNRALQARLDLMQAEEHQQGYPDMRRAAEAERAAQIAENAPAQPQNPQMSARSNAGPAMFAPAPQSIIVPNPPPLASLAGGTLGGPDDHRSGNFHLRAFPGAGIGIVVTTEGGVNIPIQGGMTAMVDQNGRRVYVIPGTEEGQGIIQRDAYFPIVRSGSINVSCLQRPPLEVQAAGVYNSRVVGRSITLRVDASRSEPFEGLPAGFCGE